MTVRLITGPPCAGKTTYVREHAAPGDVILDFDDICREVGGSDQWAHSQQTRSLAGAIMNSRIAALRGHDGDAWIIRCAPEPHVRTLYATRLDAEVYVLDPGLTVCLARARTRPRGTTRVIRGWYLRYLPAPCDITIPYRQEPVYLPRR